MDRWCVYYRKPLLESGTLGTKGNVVVVVVSVVVILVLVVVSVICSSILCGQVCTWIGGASTIASLCWSLGRSALRAMSRSSFHISLNRTRHRRIRLRSPSPSVRSRTSPMLLNIRCRYAGRQHSAVSKKVCVCVCVHMACLYEGRYLLCFV